MAGCVWLAAAVLMLSAVTLTGVAPASAETSATDIKKAKRLDQQGKVAAKRGDFADAAIAFEAAYDLHPEPKYLFNLGLAQMKAEQFDLAIASLERYLATNPPDADRDEVDDEYHGTLQRTNPGMVWPWDDTWPEGLVIAPIGDNCPQTPDADQADADEDGVGDACE